MALSKKLKALFTENRALASVVSSIFVSVLVVMTVVSAATTVGTNVTVDGTLTQTGNAAFAGTLTTNGPLYASTTALFTSGLTTYADSTFGNGATDVNLFTGTLQASTTALFTSGLTTYADSTFGNGATDVNLFTGTVQASTTALFTSGLTSYSNASSSQATVGGGTTLTGIVAGYCNIVGASITASSSSSFDCTGGDIAKVRAGDRVMVMATSSLASRFYVQAASSTLANATINLVIFNQGTDASAADPGSISFNFWAFR